MPQDDLDEALEARFGRTLPAADDLDAAARARLAEIAARRSHRAFAERALSPGLVRLLVATALAAPSKSDLQQADVVIVEDRARRDALADLVPTMPWVRTAPAFLVVCGNGRRIRRIGEMRDHPFANDHLDAFFNAAVDGGILLAFLVRAAEAAGLGCCPVSVLRNRAEETSAVLALPDLVFPVAGLALGWPAAEGAISPRLDLDTVMHPDRFDDAALEAEIAAYDRRRHAVQPYRRQRRTDIFGEVGDYGWSEEKARHYALSERADFGAYVRARGFRLD